MDWHLDGRATKLDNHCCKSVWYWKSRIWHEHNMCSLDSQQMLYSVVVSTSDSESGNPGSNPGTAIIVFACFLGHKDALF